MKIEWKVEKADIAKVKAFLRRHQDNAFVNYRIECNLSDSKTAVSRSKFWDVMVGCLLTTQQRSGPDSKVARFLRTRPSPLRLVACEESEDLEAFVVATLTAFGGLRRTKSIAREVAANLAFLQNGGWKKTRVQLEAVRLSPTIATERRAATFIDECFRGFGPKQSRNLLQGLGLSQFEVPIDSRITKWLNDFGFPVHANAASLADRRYYEFVSDGFQRLCEACKVTPCVLDAAIFASYDQDAWTTENVVW